MAMLGAGAPSLTGHGNNALTMLSVGNGPNKKSTQQSIQYRVDGGAFDGDAGGGREGGRNEHIAKGKDADEEREREEKLPEKENMYTLSKTIQNAHIEQATMPLMPSRAHREFLVCFLSIVCCYFRRVKMRLL